jgi:hypothetical protein
MFWRRQPPEPDDSEPETLEGPSHDLARHGELVPIRIFTEDEIVDGWTQVGSQRLSDILNAEDVLSVSRVDHEPSEDDWLPIERDHMMLVVPPPHASPRQLRVHRHRREITAHSDRYAIRGIVHTIPGNRLDRTVLRTRQHFLPITDARLVAANQPDVEEEYEVVLINVVNAGEDLTLDVAE